MTTTTETKPRRSMRRRLKSLRTPIAAALAGGAAVVLLAVGLVLAVNLISGVRSATELLTDKIELIIGLIENAVDAELQPARDQTVYLAEILSEKLTSRSGPDRGPADRRAGRDPLDRWGDFCPRRWHAFSRHAE